ncbi:transcription activator effector-binding protein [Oceanihabitans sp. IOP_32]|uniref:SRPBCC family protein n=1 Tax=Oceanihabitans sp. IOP_32 TaxID=2529032 RepID=UPI00129377FF|nr:GyrI-like domain-containing protein [Oceanihabitans sp. IOP_32]QFZ55251.1 transcription activator effector-binding protein [Oceanihabitans sp. IOP_32]
MKKLKYLLFLLLIGIIGTAIYVAVQPNDFKVTRSHTIPAPTAVVFNNVVDFKNWEFWSSWVETNPELQITLSEETEGLNALLSWQVKDDKGSIKTTEITKNTLVKQQLQFGDYPPSEVLWEFDSSADGSTQVSWTVSAKDLPFDYKFYTVFSGDLEEEIGGHLERSLKNLDSVVVHSMKVYSVKIDGVTEYGGGFYMYKTTSATGVNMSDIMDEQYHAVLSYMTNQSIAQTGKPFTIYHSRDSSRNEFIMSQAIPVQNKVVVTGNSAVLCGYMPKIRVLKATLKGDYRYLPEAWETVQNYLNENYMERSDVLPFEIYQNDPKNVPNPADWITEIYFPIK